MKAKRIISLICLILICAAILASCGRKAEETRVCVATVDGVDISAGTYAFYLELIKETIANVPEFNIVNEESWNTVEIDNQKAINFAKEKALDNLVKDTIQVAKAKEMGITLSDDDRAEIQSQKDKFAFKYGGAEAFKEHLKVLGVSEDEFNTIFENFTYVSKYKEKVIAENADVSDVSDAEIKEEYDRLIETYYQNSINAKYLLIMFRPDGKTERTEEEAFELAKALYDRAAAGEEFETLVMKYSEDTADVDNGGIGYQFVHKDNTMPLEFDEAAYMLGVGEISEPVGTMTGYYIIKRYMPEGAVPTLESLSESIRTQFRDERYMGLLEQWKADAVIVKNDDAINEI